jgi:hypothetical protein
MQRREFSLGDYTLDLKRAQSMIIRNKTLTIVEDHRETTNTYNSHLI